MPNFSVSTTATATIDQLLWCIYRKEEKESKYDTLAHLIFSLTSFLASVKFEVNQGGNCSFISRSCSVQCTAVVCEMYAGPSYKHPFEEGW